MQTVKSCCCGCTLRTGALILLWLNAIFATLSIVSTIATAAALQTEPFSYVLIKIVIRAIMLGIYVMGIYGVEKERPAFLKPYLALQVILIVLIIIAMVLMAIFGTAIVAVIADTAGSSQSAGDEKEAGVAAAVIVLVEIGCLVYLGLAYYFFIVVLSFYKELRGEIPQQ